MNRQIGLSCGHFQLLSLQNVAKSIPDINIHLARRFQPVGYLSARTRAIWRAPAHSWAPDRPQKQATGKADRRGVDSEIAINC